MLKVDVADDVIVVIAEGTITHDDYENFLIPEVNAAVKKHGKVNLLYWLGPKFDSFTFGAMWDDTQLGFKHLTDFAKIAIVSDSKLIRTSANLFTPLIPAEVMIYDNADIDAANNWIRNT